MSRSNNFVKSSVRTSYISTVVGLTLILFIMGIIALIGFVGKNQKTNLLQTTEVDIFFKPQANNDDKKKVELYLKEQAYVVKADLISSEEALLKIEETMGEEEKIEFELDHPPIPESILVKIEENFVQVDSMRSIKKRLEGKYADVILEVSYDENNVEKISNISNKSIYWFLAFSLVLIAVAVALINNTIRLAIYAKRFSIKTMTLVGAKSSFIRRPFLINALIQGLIAGLLAVVLIITTLYVISNFNLVNKEDLVQSIELTTFAKVFGGIVIFGIAISFISTYLVMFKYLRAKMDSLY